MLDQYSSDQWRRVIAGYHAAIADDRSPLRGKGFSRLDCEGREFCDGYDFWFAHAREANPGIAMREHPTGVRREAQGDDLGTAIQLHEPTIAFWQGVTREQCPHPAGTEDAERWLRVWDEQCRAALGDLMANREIVRHSRAIRAALETASHCLLACEKIIKSPNLRMRCRSERARLNGLARTIGDERNADVSGDERISP